MAKKEKKETRFEVILEEGNGLSTPYRSILVDTTTGVQYLYVQAGNAGGLSPLLDRDGRPLTRNC